MSSTTCPQCGGLFEFQLLGPLKDKVLACPYCGAKIDVPDAYRRTTETTTARPDGERGRVTVSELRSDFPVVVDASGDPQKDLDALRAALQAHGEVFRDGETVTVVREVSNPGELPQDLIDRINAGGALGEAFVLPGGEGKSFHVFRETDVLKNLQLSARAQAEIAEVVRREEDAGRTMPAPPGFARADGTAIEANVQIPMDKLSAETRAEVTAALEKLFPKRVPLEHTAAVHLKPTAPQRAHGQHSPSNVPPAPHEPGLAFQATVTSVTLVKWLVVLALVILAIVVVLTLR